MGIEFSGISSKFGQGVEKTVIGENSFRISGMYYGKMLFRFLSSAPCGRREPARRKDNPFPSSSEVELFIEKKQCKSIVLNDHHMVTPIYKRKSQSTIVRVVEVEIEISDMNYEMVIDPSSVLNKDLSGNTKFGSFI